MQNGCFDDRNSSSLLKTNASFRLPAFANATYPAWGARSGSIRDVGAVCRLGISSSCQPYAISLALCPGEAAKTAKRTGTHAFLDVSASDISHVSHNSHIDIIYNIAFMMFWGFSWQRFADILAALHDGICPLAQQGRQQLSAGRSASG